MNQSPDIQPKHLIEEDNRDSECPKAKKMVLAKNAWRSYHQWTRKQTHTNPSGMHLYCSECLTFSWIVYQDEIYDETH